MGGHSGREGAKDDFFRIGGLDNLSEWKDSYTITEDGRKNYKDMVEQHTISSACPGRRDY